MAQKVSEITTQDIANYLRLVDPAQEDLTFIDNCKEVAKEYIKNYTGVADLDTHTDFTIIVYMLCQSMYDTRSIQADNDKLNIVFETILGFHRKNLL